VVGETRRHALNVLAEVAPDWLRAHGLPPEWAERAGRRIEEYRLPKGTAEREAYANEVGADGWRVRDALDDPLTPGGLRDLPAVSALRRVWEQQDHPRAPREHEVQGWEREGRSGAPERRAAPFESGPELAL
jgi:transposase